MATARRFRSDLRQFVSGKVPESRIVTATNEVSVSDELSRIETRGLVARGAGRNYGDAADNTGGTVLLLSRSGRIEVSADGVLSVGAGVTLGRVLETVHPLGWTLPVLPATRHVTVGGAVASDVHGKNHAVRGSFGHHVRSVTLVAPVGTATVTRVSDPELLDATVGGMGLTGVILDVEIQLRRAETAWLSARHRRCGSLEEIFAAMRESTSEFRIAWLDAFARGASLGRGIVVTADDAPCTEVSARHRGDPRGVEWRSLGRIPPRGVPRLLHDSSVGLFNRTWHRRAARRVAPRTVRFDGVLTPLDVLEGWNRLYGRRGFVQYQFAVPDERSDFIADCLERLRRADCLSYFTTMKRLGAPTGRYLSFARAGWSLSLDIPRGAPGLLRVLDELDRDLVAAGGRLYLAKDSRAAPETIGAMYPELDEFRRIQRRLDPHGDIRSDLARRLRLTE